MIAGSRFIVQRSAARVLICDLDPPMVDGVPASCRWGAPGLWRTVETRGGIHAVFELRAPSVTEVPASRRSRAERARAAARARMRSLDSLIRNVADALGPGGSRAASEPVAGRDPETGSAASGSTLPSPSTPPGRRGAALTDAVVEWALRTADGGLDDPDWEAPLRETIPDATAALLRTEGRWVVTQRRVVDLRVPWEARRVALVAPVVLELTPRLAAARHDWIRSLCLGVRSTWALARVLVRRRDVPTRGRKQDCVAAEVDLSGAPPELIPRLVVEGHAALGAALASLDVPLELASEPRVRSRLLSRGPAAPLDPTPGASSGAFLPSTPNEPTFTPW